jgi:type IV pilus assembly protein PilY1
MKVLQKHLNKYMSLVLLLMMSITVYSSPLKLTHEPLFLNQTVPPALAVTFDDSGSMSWSWMPDSRSFSSSRPSFASPDYNLIYYNPNINYKPPVNADGTPLPNSEFNNAKRDGYAEPGMITNKNLRTSYRPFRTYYPNYAGNSYSLEYASAGRTNSNNRAFYYRWIGPANATLTERRNQNNNYQLVEIFGAQQKQNFANWYSYYNTRSKLAKAAVSHAFVNFGPDFKIDWQQLNRNRFNSGTNYMETFETGHREDFYDWLFKVPGSGGTPLRQATKYAGELFRDSYSGQSVYYDDSYGDELSCQQNFHIAISDGSWNGNRGIEGNVDNGTTTITNRAIPYTSTIANKYFYDDNNSSSLADTAFYYWIRDLKPSLDNDVPRFIDDYTDSSGNVVTVASGDNWWDEPELVWNPNNDPANWQHMVNFNIGLGIEGSFNRDTDLPALRAGLLSWPDTYDDTCFKRNALGVEVTRTCRNHLCYNGSTTASDIVECNGIVKPLGDIQLCMNADTNEAINCADRIVRRVNESQGRVDDVWHSSVNSRGDYFSAKDPQELAEALYKVVANIIKRKGRASAGSVSSNIISNESLAYKTGYDTSDWSGFVVANQLNIDGTLGDVEWDAACKLTGGPCNTMIGNPVVSQSKTHATRNIFTYNYETKTKHPFHTTSMSTAQIGKILDSDYINSFEPPITDLTTAADSVIHFVRGDRSVEQQNGGDFRNRRNLLGDVINSSAKIIRGPSASYNDQFWGAGSPERLAADSGTGYSEFKVANVNRNNVLLVGANDGMLHAFDAGINSTNGGDELWAYIPSKSLNGISEFANPAYKHTSYVDAAPFVLDSYINNSWSTVALGGMRHGGKLFYALDLGGTPESEPNVLWEFTDENDPDMGYSYSGGIIARIAYPDSDTSVASKWVAFVPNGYNSTSHKSVMYAIDLETGLLLHKWDTGIGNITNPNGMGPPVAADFIAYDESDTNNTFYGADQGADFIYAGDLHGNIYRFNVADIFTGNSTTEILFNGTRDRAITAAPRLYTPDDGSENIIVTFGTGKYLELPDRGITGVASQYIFGLKDSKAPITSSYSLSDSRIIEQVITTNTAQDARTLSENYVSVSNSWKIKLPETGERSTNTFGRNNQSKLLIAATIIPNGDNPCLPGGNSWLMIIDANTGSSPASGRVFNNGNDDGILRETLVIGPPTLLTTAGGNQTILIIDGADGDGINDSIAPILLDKGERWRRRSWHRIIFD